MKAALLKAMGDWNETLYTDDNVPVPTPEDDEVLIGVKAAAFNPMDWKIARTGFFVQSWPMILGYDVSGVIEQLGKNVKGLAVGDEVFAMTSGGGFAEYAVAPALRTLKKPSNITFAQASSLGITGRTALVTLFTDLGLNLHRINEQHKFENEEWVLITGGATTTGIYAVQFARAAGYKVITTASTKNHEYLKSLGATHVIDYTLSPETQISHIKSIAPSLRLALDCVGPQTSVIAASALSATSKPVLAAIANNHVPDDIHFPEHVEIKPLSGFAPEDLEDLKKMFEVVVGEVEKGTIRSSEVEVLGGDLGEA
ncbi:hypothetical protein HK097_000487, partial [Rhizophlyctis rosea]